MDGGDLPKMVRADRETLMRMAWDRFDRAEDAIGQARESMESGDYDDTQASAGRAQDHLGEATLCLLVIGVTTQPEHDTTEDEKDA